MLADQGMLNHNTQHGFGLADPIMRAFGAKQTHLHGLRFSSHGTIMSIAFEPHEAFHRGTAPIFALLTPEQTEKLSNLQVDSTLEDRLAELARKTNEGNLTPAERAEYEGYIEANNLLAVLQAEARLRLSSRES